MQAVAQIACATYPAAVAKARPGLSGIAVSGSIPSVMIPASQGLARRIFSALSCECLSISSSAIVHDAVAGRRAVGHGDLESVPVLPALRDPVFEQSPAQP